MYYLAVCDSDGKCIGFLKNNMEISKNPDDELNELMSFKKKSDSNERVMQINLGHSLLPDGFPYRVTTVKG